MASKAQTARYTATRDVDYVSAGVTYDVEAGKKFAYFRRTDDSSGTQMPMWQFKRAVADGSVVAA